MTHSAAMLHLHRLTDARKFLDLTSTFLAAREAENSLILGLAATLQRNPTAYSSEKPYFGAVSIGNDVIAAALMTPPNMAVLSWSENEEAVRMLAGDVWTFRLDTPGVHGPRPTSAWFAEAWDTLTSLEPVLSVAERRLHLAWEPNLEIDGPLTLEVRTTDTVGLLAEMSRAFSHHGINIKQANCRAYDSGQRAINTFQTTVRSLKQLNSLKATLRDIPGVLAVERVFSRAAGD